MVMAYHCPMHSDVSQANAGVCPKCHMTLVPDDARFGLLRHMFSSPLHVAVMTAAMLALMAAAMLLLLH